MQYQSSQQRSDRTGRPSFASTTTPPPEPPAPLIPPAHGQWVTITLQSGEVDTWRFVSQGSYRPTGTELWIVDRGKYGLSADECYIPVAGIVSIQAAPKPEFILSYQCPLRNKRRYVGRYVSKEVAEHAIIRHRIGKFSPIITTAGGEK